MQNLDNVVHICYEQVGCRVGRSCACLEPKGIQKEAKIYQKRPNYNFSNQINAKKPKSIANSFLIVLGIDTVKLLFYNQCDD